MAKKKQKKKLHILGKTTLFKKLLAFYLVIVVASFYFMLAFGRTYIYDYALEETAGSIEGAADRLIASELTYDYTEESLQESRTSFDVAAKASNCQVLIISTMGDIILDTENKLSHPYYNVIAHGEQRFLRKSPTYDYTIGGYLSTSSLCISVPLRNSPGFQGYLVFAHSNTFIEKRADYYYGILLTVYYILLGMLLLTYIGIFFFCFLPLRKLRNGSKDFAIGRDNPPIVIKSNDEYGEMADTLNVLGKELSKFDEYQRKFLSSISHDFRSPLTSIHGYLQAFKDGLIPPDQTEHYYDILLAETDRLTKLTNEIIDLNSYDKDNILLSVKSFDIHDMITKVTQALDGRAEKKRIRFDTVLADRGSLHVDGDPDKIHQVLFNLVENAIKFNFEDSVITIKTELKKDRVLISVKDTGIGIPKKDINSIWDRFYKSDLSRGRDKSGTGLGLSICKEIITAHKETIDVISTEGAGSTFTFRLPLSH
ncbi:MAG: HAMP domain-containing histidine kinase [Eubacterium sp.]|nr:HAMP domain-containing histidine kinase [Eubacterium sp.]